MHTSGKLLIPPGAFLPSVQQKEFQEILSPAWVSFAVCSSLSFSAIPSALGASDEHSYAVLEDEPC